MARARHKTSTVLRRSQSQIQVNFEQKNTQWMRKEICWLTEHQAWQLFCDIISLHKAQHVMDSIFLVGRVRLSGLFIFVLFPISLLFVFLVTVSTFLFISRLDKNVFCYYSAKYELTVKRHCVVEQQQTIRFILQLNISRNKNVQNYIEFGLLIDVLMSCPLWTVKAD